MSWVIFDNETTRLYRNYRTNRVRWANQHTARREIVRERLDLFKYGTAEETHYYNRIEIRRTGMKKLYVEQVLTEDVVIQPGQRAPKAYKVTKVTNARAPQIFQILNPKELGFYCESDLWEVTIT